MPDTLLLRACLQLIQVLSALAPEWRRDDWRREWLAELHFRASRLAAHRRLTTGAQLALFARCCGAAFHVLWLWKHHWGIDMLSQDIRYGIRMLTRRPAFATVAVLTLALGIGATTAIFSAVHTVLLKPLPYPDPQRIVRVNSLDTRAGQQGIGNLSVPDVVDFQRLATSFDAIGAHNSGGYFTMTGSGEPERVPRLLVTSGYFRVLHAQPAAGRLFTREEDRPTPPDNVVISHGFWQRRFGGDPAIIGRTITLNGQAGMVVGVLGPEFVHPDPRIEAAPDVFALLDPDENMSGRGGRYVRGIVRMKPGVTIDQATSELQSVAARLATDFPKSNAGRSVALRRLVETVTGDLRTPLILLQAATVAILLIACANLANLLLGAGTGRAEELSIRTALGAGRIRIVRQLLTESLVLSVAGGGLGLGCAWWATTYLSKAAGRMLLPQQRITIDPGVFAFALAISVAAGVIFGLVPAVYASRGARGSTLDARRRHTDSPGRGRLRSSLVVAEVALSVTLLIGATLLVRSFRELTHVDPGFRADQVMSFQLAVSPTQAPDGTEAAFYERLYGRLRTLPGVTSAAGVNILPLSGGYSCDGFQIDGRMVTVEQERCAEARSASAGYFETMGMRLVRGRLFTAGDDGAARRVVIVNEALARQFFPGEDPLAHRLIYSSRGQKGARGIVGVVADVRHFGPQNAVRPEFYVPQPQPPTYRGMTVVMRVDGDPAALMPAVRAAVRELAPDVPLYNVRTLQHLLDVSISDARFRTQLLALFAGLALLLAIIGTYGVISLVVAQRTQEMGIRLALGARPSDILRLVLGGGLRAIVAGTLIGLAGGLAVSRAITALLFNVTPSDPLTFATAALAILIAGLVATWIPARRACRVDPAIALRSE